ncbi:MAG: lactate/malate family dehydrogenase [Chlamydiia bacterium]
MSPQTFTLAVTGAAGQVAYAWLFLQLHQLERQGMSVDLRLCDVEAQQGNLRCIADELIDCASPALRAVSCHQSPEEAFEGASSIVLFGGLARQPGMSRSDLLLTNASIMADHGKAIGRTADPCCDVLVVANPCNTNALVAWSHSGRSPHSFRAMTRLDHQRAAAALAQHIGVPVAEVSRACVWGNHSETCVPDRWHARVGGKPAVSVVPESWLADEWPARVRGRGGDLLRRRGHSAAGSAAWAALLAWRDPRALSPGEWASCGLWTEEGTQLPAGLYCGVACTSMNGRLTWVADALEPDLLAALRPSLQELTEERDTVRHLLGGGGA